jgi:putative sigma-54 modulation protein
VEVTIRGRNVEVPQAVKRAATDKLSKLGKFVEGLDHAEVCLSEQRNPRISDKEVCEVTLRGNGHLIRAKATAAEMPVALERAIEKVEHQLQKVKTRRPRRASSRRGEPVASNSEQAGDDSDDDDDNDGGPRIVKTKQFSIKPMTPEEAALQMDLLGHDFFFFTNAETLRAAVVYQRDDGQIGLIDSQ